MSGYDYTRPIRFDAQAGAYYQWDGTKWVPIASQGGADVAKRYSTNIYRYDPGAEAWYEYDPTVPGGWKAVGSVQPNPQGQPTPGGTLPPNVTPPPPPAPPDPYQNWLKSDPNTRTYRYFDEGAQEFYESNPTQAWGQYVSAMFGDRATPFLNYAQDKYQQYYNEYLKNSEANAGADTSFTQSLTQKNADDIRRAFGMEVASVRGVTNPFLPSGRFTG